VSQRKSAPSLSSLEKCKLSKSFAFRVGAIETLKPLEYIPNSPVSRSDEKLDWNFYGFNTIDNSEEQDSDEEIDHSLADRFRAYADAINLENGDYTEDSESVKGEFRLNQNSSVKLLPKSGHQFKTTKSSRDHEGE
jgi:hypothetical protein